MTRAQIANGFNVGDWFPNDHPKLPYVVQYGKAPDVRACGLCHLINGKGRPENASVSGLPVAYFLQQLQDFRNDLRKSADPRKANTNVMTTIAKGMSDEEMKAAAHYFADSMEHAMDQSRREPDGAELSHGPLKIECGLASLRFGQIRIIAL